MEERKIFPCQICLCHILQSIKKVFQVIFRFILLASFLPTRDWKRALLTKPLLSDLDLDDLVLLFVPEVHIATLSRILPVLCSSLKVKVFCLKSEKLKRKKKCRWVWVNSTGTTWRQVVTSLTVSWQPHLQLRLSLPGLAVTISEFYRGFIFNFRVLYTGYKGGRRACVDTIMEGKLVTEQQCNRAAEKKDPAGMRTGEKNICCSNEWPDLCEIKSPRHTHIHTDTLTHWQSQVELVAWVCRKYRVGLWWKGGTEGYCEVVTLYNMLYMYDVYNVTYT